MALVVGILAVNGCGISSASPNPTKIWGRVTYNGQPLPECVVLFVPAGSNKTNNWAAGHVYQGGNYKLSAYQSDSGLEPGRYTIFFKAPPPRYVGTRRSRALDEADSKPQAEAQAPPPAPAFPLPEKFTKPETSGLTVRLDGWPQQIDLDLKD
jgi:hypothetical protein